MSVGKSIFKVVLLAAFALSLLCAELSLAADAIRFAPLPMESQSSISQQFQPFTRFLSATLSTEVSLQHHRSYRALIDDLLADNIDLAYVGPLPFVLLQHDRDIVPLVRFLNERGGASYTCSLVTFDPILDLKQVSSKTPIALPQPYSTCGYLLTAYQLRLHGQDLDHLPYYYAGDHSAAALDVVRGKAAAAGIKTEVARSYKHLGLHIHENQMSLPGHLLVANRRTLSTTQIAAVRDALLALEPQSNPQDRELTAEWGNEFCHGAVPVRPGEYAVISDLLSHITIPEVSE